MYIQGLVTTEGVSRMLALPQGGLRSMFEETSRSIFATPCGDQKEIFSVAVDVRLPPFPSLPLPGPLCVLLKMTEHSALSANF